MAGRIVGGRREGQEEGGVTAFLLPFKHLPGGPVGEVLKWNALMYDD